MSQVRLLEDAVIDRIAAGEVVERPASVLKELVENAIDAGAQSLTLTLEQGGCALIRVLDDGVGMDRADAMLAIERHATSKLRTDADLEGITTLGFRGEALPSIASVSRFTLRTRTAAQEVGTEVRIDHGVPEGVREVAMAVGTEITVCDLFGRVPARRRFLRAPSTEWTHDIDVLKREVLMREGLTVRVRHDGRDVLHLAGGLSLGARLAQGIEGLNEADLWPVDFEQNGVRVTGLVAAPTITRSSARAAIYTWVEGRYVNDPLLRRAVLEAAGLQVAAGRYPVVAVQVFVGRGEVDVNVHPAKTEVRFRRPHEVSVALTTALVTAWQRGHGERRLVRGESSERAPGLDLFASTPAKTPTIAALPSPSLQPQSPERAYWPSEPKASWASEPVFTQHPAKSTPPAPGALPHTPDAVTRGEPRAVSAQVPPASASGRLLTTIGRFALMEASGRVFGVDVHAWLAQSPPAQARALLVPVRVSLEPAALEALLSGVERLEQAGFRVRAGGPGEVALVALPEGVRGDEPEGLVRALARGLLDNRPIPEVIAAWWCMPDATSLQAAILAWPAWQDGTGRVELDEPALAALWKADG